MMSVLSPASVSSHQASLTSTPSAPTVLTSSSQPIILVVTRSNTSASSDQSLKFQTQIKEPEVKDSPQSSTESSSTQFLEQFMDIKSLNPVVKSFLAGSISGTCSTILFQPLDLLKTRIQAPPPVGNGHVGLFTIAGHILRDEKLFGLWKGTTPSLTRCVPGVGLYFASIHGMKLLFGIDEHPSPIQSIFMGASARSFSGAVMIPFTVIKTRFESKVYQYGSIRQALKVIYRSEGIRGLTCGLLPTLLRDAPFSGLYLMMYTITKQKVPSEWLDSNTVGPYVRFSCGILAGFGASIATQPADVIKTKMQLYPEKFQTVFQVVPYMHKKYGLKGYFKGLMPRTIRRTLVAALSWTVYEQVMKTIGLQ